MKRILSLGLIFIFALALALSLGTGSVVLAEGEEDPVFTVTLEPTGTMTELTSTIVDAEVGGTVTVDLFLSYSGETTIPVNAFGIDILIPTGLSYKSIVWNIGGSPNAVVNSSKTKLRLSFVTNGNDSALINFTTGTPVKLGTLTFDVASSDLTYGDKLEIIVDTDSDFTSISTTLTVDEYFPAGVNGKVEIVTKYDITWSGLAGNDETVKVGVGIKPTHDDPVKPGYTFTGWKASVGTVYQHAADLPEATANETYTAQWTPTTYRVEFADGTAFGDGVETPTSYTIESGITVTPVKGGCTFQGWTAEPLNEGDTDYNWDTATAPIANAATIGLYGNVKLTPVWEVAADVVFAEYAYAARGEKLMLIGVSGVDADNAVKYDGNALFYTEDQYYLALLNAADGTYLGAAGNNKGETSYTKAYLYIIPNATTVANVLAALTVDAGENIVIRRDGNVNCDAQGIINAFDYGAVDNFLAGRTVQNGTVQKRLEADVHTSEYDLERFGAIDDIVGVINKIPSL